MKTCTRCKELKPLSSFSIARSQLDGLDKWCRQCHSKAHSFYRSKNREATIERDRLYKQTHRTDIKARDAVYRKTHQVEIRQRRREFLSTHPESAKQYNQKYRMNHPEKRRESTRKWDKANPVNRAIRQQRREARIRQLKSDFTDNDWKQLVLFFASLCAYCDTVQARLTQDHFLPIVLGGEYTRGNILPACLSCNSSKRDNHPRDWVVQKFGKAKYRKLLEYLSSLR